MFFPKATGKYKHRPESAHFKEPNAVLMRSKEGKYYSFSSIMDTCRFFKTSVEPIDRIKLIAKKHDIELAVYDPFSDDPIEFTKGVKIEYPSSVIDVKYTHDVLLYNIQTREVKYSTTVQLASSITKVPSVTIINTCNNKTPWPTNNHCFLWAYDFSHMGYRFKNFSDQATKSFEDKKGITNPIVVTSAFAGYGSNKKEPIDVCVSKKEVMEKYKISRRTLDKLDSCKFILHDGKRFEYL